VSIRRICHPRFEVSADDFSVKFTFAIAENPEGGSDHSGTSKHLMLCLILILALILLNGRV
jgi:hypothetical protein